MSLTEAKTQNSLSQCALACDLWTVKDMTEPPALNVEDMLLNITVASTLETAAGPRTCRAALPRLRRIVAHKLKRTDTDAIGVVGLHAGGETAQTHGVRSGETALHSH